MEELQVADDGKRISKLFNGLQEKLHVFEECTEVLSASQSSKLKSGFEDRLEWEPQLRTALLGVLTKHDKITHFPRHFCIFDRLKFCQIPDQYLAVQSCCSKLCKGVYTEGTVLPAPLSHCTHMLMRTTTHSFEVR
jgi:hypothetical protein